MRNDLIFRMFVGLTLIGVVGCGSRPRPVDPAKIKQLVTHYDDAFKEHLAEANREIGKDIVRYEPLASDVIPRKVTIHGSHHEIGRWLGLVARGLYGESGIDRLRRMPEAEEINRRIVSMYESIYPSYLDLVRGLAETFDLTLDEVDLQYVEHRFFHELWARLLQYNQFYGLTSFSSMGTGSQSNCSIVSYYEADEGCHFIGRNFDGSSDRPHFAVTTDVDGVYKTLGSACYFPYHWMMDGINEKGLFIGVATNESPSAYNEKEPEYPDEPAVQVIHMVRIALETCTTVDEALELLRSVRIWFPVEVNHLHIADEAGDAAIVEFDLDRKMVAFRKTEPHLILTNSAYQEGIAYVRDHCWRFRNAQAVVQSEAPLGGPETVCEITRGMRQTSGSNRTLWTSYFDITARQMDLRLRSEEFQVPHTFAIGFREELAEGKHESRFRDHANESSAARAHRLKWESKPNSKPTPPTNITIIALSSVVALAIGSLAGATVAVSLGWLKTGRVWKGIVGGTLGALLGGVGTSVVVTLIPALTGWPKDFFFWGDGPMPALIVVPLLAIVTAVLGAVLGAVISGRRQDNKNLAG